MPWNPYGGWWRYVDLLLPIAALSYIMSFFMKPLREDKPYIRLVFFHFA